MDRELPAELHRASRSGQRVHRTGAARESSGCISAKASASPRIVSSTYENLANSLLALQRFDDARQIIQQAQARKLDNFIFHNALYALAFLRSDSPAMEEQQRWFAGQPDVEHFGLSLASDTEAYAGHLGKARELTKRSIDSAIRADSKENGAIWQDNAALRQAALRQHCGSAASSGRGSEACSHESGRRGRSCACLCHGRRCGTSRIAWRKI